MALEIIISLILPHSRIKLSVRFYTWVHNVFGNTNLCEVGITEITGVGYSSWWLRIILDAIILWLCYVIL